MVLTGIQRRSGTGTIKVQSCLLFPDVCLTFISAISNNKMLYQYTNHCSGRQQDPHPGQQREDRSDPRDETSLRDLQPEDGHPGHDVPGRHPLCQP